MRKSDFIDVGGNVYPCCTRQEAFDRSNSARPELRPRSRWTVEENYTAATYGIGMVVKDHCPACGCEFLRRGSHAVVGCPKCEPDTLETRGLNQ